MGKYIIGLMWMVIMFGLLLYGCDDKEKKMSQEKLSRTQSELEEVRKNLEIEAEKTKKIPMLEGKIQEAQEEITKLKFDISKIMEEKGDLAKKNVELEKIKKQKSDNEEKIDKLKEENSDLKRRVRELEDALNK